MARREQAHPDGERRPRGGEEAHHLTPEPRHTGTVDDDGPSDASAFERARWKADLRLPKGAIRAWLQASPPLVAGDLVVAGGLDFAYAAHDRKKRGAVAWTVPSGLDDVRGALVAPFAWSGGVGLGVASGIAVVDVATGAVQARVELGATLVAPPAVLDDGLLLAPTVDARLAAVEPDGSLRFTTALPAAAASPVSVCDGVALLLDGEGHAVAVDVDNGAVRWRAHTGRVRSAGLAVHRGVAFFPGGEAGCLRALDVETGAERWRYDAGALVAGATCAVPPPWSGHEGATALCTTLYGRGGNRLHAVDAATGKARFVVESGYGGGLFVSAARGRAWCTLGPELLGVDVATGAVAVRVKLAHEAAAPPVASRGALFVSTTHQLVAYGAVAQG